MVDFSGTMFNRIVDYLADTQDTYNLKNLAEVLRYNTQKKQKERVKLALDTAVKYGLVRKFKKDKVWYYHSLVSIDTFKANPVDIDLDIEKVAEQDIENPKDLLTRKTLEDKKMENIFEKEVEDGI